MVRQWEVGAAPQLTLAFETDEQAVLISQAMGYRLTFDPEMLARPVFCEHIHYRTGTPYRAADLEVTKTFRKSKDGWECAKVDIGSVRCPYRPEIHRCRMKLPP
ncbi:hypothetical protein GCM10010464_41070 [Pseudonocardia yunnanensis]